MAELVKLHGLKELKRTLKKLPREIADKELNKALRAGGRPIVAMAKANVPIGKSSFVRTIRGKTWAHLRGALLQGIVMRGEKKRFKIDRAKVRIGVAVDRRSADTPWYWRFIEFGTSKMPAQPFLTPAFESGKIIANNIIIAALKKGVFKQAARLRK